MPNELLQAVAAAANEDVSGFKAIVDNRLASLAFDKIEDKKVEVAQKLYSVEPEVTEQE